MAGAAIGYVGGRLVDLASEHNWMDGTFRQLGTLAIGLGAFAGAELMTGNGFVAAFTAGLAFGVAARSHCPGAYDFAEDEGNLMALLTFMFFGAALGSDPDGPTDEACIAGDFLNLPSHSLPAALASQNGRLLLG